MTQDKVNEARSTHLKDELDYKRATNYAAVLDIEERTKVEAHKHRGILLQWIDIIEKHNADRVAKLQNQISALQYEIEEITAPRFTQDDFKYATESG